MAVAGIEARPDGRHVDRQHPGAVSAVDQHRHRRLERGDDFLHREHQCGGAGHVVDDHQPGAATDRSGDRRHHRFRSHSGKGQLGGSQHRSGALGGGGHDVGHRVVTVIGDDDLVTRREPQRPDHGGDAVSGVGHERHPGGIGSDEASERVPGLVEPRLQPPGEEVDRLTLHESPPLGLAVQHRAGAGAKRAVVEKGDARLEVPESRRVGHWNET